MRAVFVIALASVVLGCSLDIDRLRHPSGADASIDAAIADSGVDASIGVDAGPDVDAATIDAATPDSGGVDAGPRTCPPAPAGCTAIVSGSVGPCERAGRCYVLCNEASGISRSGADGACITMGGCLATITSADENDCVGAAVEGRSTDAWIGYVQPSGAASPSADWTWTCPRGGSYSNGATPNQPDDDSSAPFTESGRQQCATIMWGGSPTRRWNDADCADRPQWFVCEL